MEKTCPPPQAVVSVGDVAYRVVDLPAMFGKTLERLPVVLRLLLENTLRNTEGRERQRAVEGLLRWLETGMSEEEIAFQPARVLMHDTTSTPALVDIAAIRDALAEAGADPAVLNPVLPVDVSVDHSLAVEYHARADAAELNLRTEMRRNAERYRFLRWASKALRGVRIHPPGTGIMHTINLEQLATVASVQSIDGVPWLVPDTLIGTDSHTPMINGIGVLGWGVGGLEAQTVMFGMPVMQRIPDVIGVRLLGALAAGTSATDLALTVTQALRDIGVSGEFVEFFGPGVVTLSAGERAVVANMAPEYGATTGFFPVDARTLDYLRATGRPQAHVARVEALHRRAGLWFDPHNAPRYTRVIEIDLAAVRLHVAGPRRPQDLLPYTDTGLALSALGKADVDADTDTAGGLPAHPVAIAAITSCTNTSDPAQLIAAGLVARRARERGLRVPDWVKTSLAPGSPAAAEYLRRAGLIDDLSAVGFDIVGFGCTTCIGNSGPLTAPIQQAIADGTAAPVAVLSGNRNFPGRVHPDLSLGFIMSPPLVIAFALAGDAACDLSRQPLQTAPDGTPVHLRDLWPTRAEIDALVRQGTSPADYRHAFAIASANPAWAAIDAPDAPRYPWDAGSTALRRPPFASADAGSQLGDYEAYPLLVLGDDITTDHISPASAIPQDSFVADFLVARGDDRNDLNVFASRRGNWEVMVRAAFYSKTLVNLLAPGLPVAHTLHVPSGQAMPVFEAAQRYRDDGASVVLLAGARYGTGSSRDWAAKGQRLLGVRAVIAVSFERIHRSNLIGMGILPLRFPEGICPQALAIRPGDTIHVEASPERIGPRCAVPVRVRRADGSVERFVATAAVETQLETTLLRCGGVIPAILGRTLQAQRALARAVQAGVPPPPDVPELPEPQ
ncbi:MULTISPECIES: aconitate hydratase AcnA [Ralstonia solanacearum species complex]|uniref:aconitate hydratase AcnA n=1 Tax=Ralstonia solanacearum species complex TaxID=3116862 RepID=UPI0005032DC5|nr:aconitate hydratase AcnA [Ralstonia solanacearum]ALF89830.1 Aconitate hydratase [Ralstonia solanacearum]ATI29329.1 aconitate hydratase 1 [Ralstonia solanacearum]KFX77753.1 aconitate hydratase [Ralstonia solanacearum]KFZ95972.1 aconitate hydratase [Ralstonia solanacearum]MDN4065232.1 aconitate hydratase AcnA [Ralstonia solanacearum]